MDEKKSIDINKIRNAILVSKVSEQIKKQRPKPIPSIEEMRSSPILMPLAPRPRYRSINKSPFWMFVESERLLLKKRRRLY